VTHGLGVMLLPFAAATPWTILLLHTVIMQGEEFMTFQQGGITATWQQVLVELLRLMQPDACLQSCCTLCKLLCRHLYLSL
jgi:hypothetical protein